MTPQEIEAKLSEIADRSGEVASMKAAARVAGEAGIAAWQSLVDLLPE